VPDIAKLTWVVQRASKIASPPFPFHRSTERICVHHVTRIEICVIARPERCVTHSPVPHYMNLAPDAQHELPRVVEQLTSAHSHRPINCRYALVWLCIRRNSRASLYLLLHSLLALRRRRFSETQICRLTDEKLYLHWLYRWNGGLLADCSLTLCVLCTKLASYRYLSMFIQWGIPISASTNQSVSCSAMLLEVDAVVSFTKP